MIKITVPSSMSLFVLEKKTITCMYIKGCYKVYKIIFPNSIKITIQNENFIVLQSVKNKIFLKHILFLYKFIINRYFLQSIIKNKKILSLFGVGYKFYLNEIYSYLAVDAGFSDLKIIRIPNHIDLKILGRKENILKLSSLNYQLIGEFAAEIQKLKIPDSYQGKGIRMQNKKFILKASKKPKQK